MSSPHRVYTEEFKREAVRLSYESGLTIIEVASDLGIGRSTLNTWRREFRDDDSPVATSEESSEKELSRLRRENQILRAERDLLKKATAFFAKESR